MTPDQGRADERAFCCPCGLTTMLTTPPGSESRLIASTLRCQLCDLPVQPVPTAWDQP